MKHATAILASIFITAIVGLGILFLGADALFNKNTVPLQSSPATLSGVSQTISSSQPLQAQLDQYKAQLADTQAQLDQANQTLAQYQSLIDALQQAGLIRVQSDGSILIRGGFGNR